MKHILVVATFSILLFACGTSKSDISDLAYKNPVAASIDLTKVVDDKAPVTINPGRFILDTVIYRMPRIIQGSYAVEDFGKYIEDLKAFDYSGTILPVVRINDNTWQIANATRLDKLEYLVNDTFDLENHANSREEIPFSPGGTNISPENYVLNLHGFIGYFDALKNAQYTLDITAPAIFERTSALQSTNLKSSPDGTKITTSYFAPRYFDITDNPMMYGNLDVEEFMVGDVKIVLSVYSPNSKHKVSTLKATVSKMMEAQIAYLGDMNATSRYDIYLYLTDRSEGQPKGIGALEHHTSTVAVLLENSTEERLAKSVIDIVGHEFFHIVTPLTVHSEDVHYFDYNEPTFSKHLWMYEGVTEYFAQHFQAYQGLITSEDYYKVVNSEIHRSRGYYDDEMSFTEMSENILEEPFKSNYGNVYEKGPLLGMCLDILLREESNGNRSMLSLMKELSNIYGIEKPFKDDLLIDEIIDMTYPSIGEFFKTHIVGATPIDYSTFLEKVGLTFEETRVEIGLIQSGAGSVFEADKDKGIVFFSSNVKDNSFWVKNGVNENDIVKSVNGKAATIENARVILIQLYGAKIGDDIHLVIDRNGEEIIIKTKLTQAYSTKKNIVENSKATSAQIKIRKAWLNNASNTEMLDEKSKSE
ncbi:M61 family metallopeptidase [Psychroserpens ponticola]|uniref:Peptidase M61 n=1 Tax=Psychroserpens ponticola TaxID=2932268 RepID=A0ABY7S162_9FLAO|nr:peptidase M61 [Psychroserpens ponticola]WCO02747.1 peptidase M61 [Psychroserpens ponticola]